MAVLTSQYYMQFTGALKLVFLLFLFFVWRPNSACEKKNELFGTYLHTVCINENMQDE